MPVELTLISARLLAAVAGLAVAVAYALRGCGRGGGQAQAGGLGRHARVGE
jgi:hypothetical protein